MAQLYRTLTGQSQKSTGRNSVDSSASKPTAPALDRTTTTNTMFGVLNHLTEPQQKKLDLFKERLEREGWWTPNGVNGKPSHDDGTLLRYLRARKFDVNGAVGQFSDTEKWMKEQRVEELYEHFDVDFYERARAMYPQWTGHRDKRGIPVYVFQIKGLDSKNVSKYQKESQAYKDKLPNHKNLTTPAKLLPLFALYHNLLSFVLPMCSTLERPHPEIPVTNSINIVDIEGVGLTQFWNLKQHMQDASVLATAHYPETLDKIFIIGAPSFFPTVWSWIKRWFDPVTVSKIFILSKSEVKSTLEKHMDLTGVPTKYGGTLNWKWGDLPDVGPVEREAIEKDGTKGWISGPCLWLDGQRVVVGSKDGQLRRADSEIAEKKPIVYAADYTEEPVHEDRKASVVGQAPTNGVVTTSDPNKHAVLAAQKATGTSSRPTTPGTAQSPAVAVVPAPKTEKSANLLPQTTKDGSILTSPMGDSQVHLPNDQPAPPAQTAEYISPASSPKPAAAEPPAVVVTTPAPSSQPLPKEVVPPTTSTTSNNNNNNNNNVMTSASPPPPGQPVPGPLSDHQVQMHKAIANQMAGESISTIPPSSGKENGDIPHPEIVVASDAAKGLAVEAEKMNLGVEGQTGKQEPTRPEMERFVTAQAF